jgi:hypothetical protein
MAVVYAVGMNQGVTAELGFDGEGDVLDQL